MKHSSFRNLKLLSAFGNTAGKKKEEKKEGSSTKKEKEEKRCYTKKGSISRNSNIGSLILLFKGAKFEGRNDKKEGKARNTKNGI